MTVASGGLLKTYGAGIEINAAIANDGTIEIKDGGTLKISTSISGAGSVKIDGGATFELNGSDSQTVAFNGDNAVFKIDGSSFGGSISGFAATDEIDLQGIALRCDDHRDLRRSGVLTLLPWQRIHRHDAGRRLQPRASGGVRRRDAHVDHFQCRGRCAGLLRSVGNRRD